MSTTDTNLISQAEALVASRFARLCDATVKMASFRTANGRQLGLAKVRSTAIYLWAEEFNPAISGVEINNRELSGTAIFAGPDAQLGGEHAMQPAQVR